MLVMDFLKLFTIVFILLYRLGFSPLPLALWHADKPFGYLIFPKFLDSSFYIHHLDAYTALSLLFK